MEAHDFISFIQRNGENIASLAFGDGYRSPVAGSSSNAMLVRVPKSYTMAEIEAWPTADFLPFAAVRTTFSRDNRRFDFEDSAEYSEAIHNKSADAGIWESSKYPGEWLVCFLENEYEAFVLQMVSPSAIPRAYYVSVFTTRCNASRPWPKKEAFSAICESFASID